MNLGVDMWSRGIFNKHLVVIGFHLLVFLSIGVYVLFILSFNLSQPSRMNV